MSKLTIAAVRALEPRDKRYEVPDGSVAGLVVRVATSGIKSFALYYRRASDATVRRLTLGRFGGVGGMTLHEARKRAGENLQTVRAGGDPGEERKRQRAEAKAAKSGGGPRSLVEEVRNYLDVAARELRPKTIETYRIAADKFAAWVETERILAPTELTRAHLTNFRAYLIVLPRHSAKAGARRGTKHATAAKRSPMSVNRELRTLKTILNALRRAGKLPQLDRDAITDCLGGLKTDQEQPAYLSRAKIAKLLAACDRHDAALFTETRNEHAGRGAAGTTPRYKPIRPFAAFLLFTGCRRGEALALQWEHVELDATDHDDKVVGEIRLPASVTKTHRARTVQLDVCPSLRRLLAEMQLQATGSCVFEGYTPDLVNAARARLQHEYGGPAFDWQTLRSTCATYLTNAPGIFGAATAYLSARQLGHSVAVAERHYTGVVRVSREARTLEEAMRCVASPGRGDSLSASTG